MRINLIKLSRNKIIALSYWTVVILFSLLEPWGNIDTRDFSYMGAWKFWEYNAYIAFVLIAMVALGIFIWKNKTALNIIIWMSVVNTMFIVMNLFDLFHFFPDPAQPLPPSVSLIEIATSIITFMILIESPKLIKKNQLQKKVGKFLGIPYDFRRPTKKIIKERFWNPNDKRIFTPHVFGWGWSLNLYQILKNFHLLSKRHKERRK